MEKKTDKSFIFDKFELPDEWDDDETMYRLLQPIKRPKHVDPRTYTQKVSFWKELIQRYCMQQHVLVVNEAALKSVFSRNFSDERMHLSPQCLQEVFAELCNEGVIVPYDPSEGGILYRVANLGFEWLIKKPAFWAMEYFSGKTTAVNNNKTENDCFIFKAVAEKLANSFITWFHRCWHDERVIPLLPVYLWKSIQTALETYFPHEATRNYVEHLIFHQKQCAKLEIVRNDGDSEPLQFVWLADRLDSRVPVPEDKEAAKLETTVIAGQAQLKAVLARQEAEEHRLEQEVNERRAKVKQLVAEKRMMEAKRLLRRVKLTEANLARKQVHLQNLEAMQLQVDSAADNRAVLDALAEAGKVLQRTTGGTEGLIRAEKTMDDLAESIDECREISETISSFGKQGIDESELEAELRDLLVGPRAPIVPPVKHSTPAAKPKDKPVHDDLEAELAALNVADLDLPELKDLPKLPSASEAAGRVALTE